MLFQAKSCLSHPTWPSPISQLLNEKDTACFSGIGDKQARKDYTKQSTPTRSKQDGEGRRSRK